MTADDPSDDTTEDSTDDPVDDDAATDAATDAASDAAPTVEPPRESPPQQATVPFVADGGDEPEPDAFWSALDDGAEARATGQRGRDSLERYRTALENDDPERRAWVFRQLPKVRFDRFASAEGVRLLAVFAETLESDPTVEVRRRAAWALGRSFAVTERLVEPPEGPEEPVAHRLTAALTTALREDADATVRERAATGFGSVERPPALLEAAGTLGALTAAVRTDAAASVRGAAASALGFLAADPRCDPALTDAVHDVGGVDALTAALDDDSAQVRGHAGAALLRIQGASSRAAGAPSADTGVDASSAASADVAGDRGLLDHGLVDRCYDVVRAALTDEGWPGDPLRDTRIDEHTFDHPAVFAPLQSVFLDVLRDPATLPGSRRENAVFALEGLGSYTSTDTVAALRRLRDGDGADGLGAEGERSDGERSDDDRSNRAAEAIDAVRFRAQVQCRKDDVPGPAPGFDCEAVLDQTSEDPEWRFDDR